ncbi:hypothetical protein [Amycolatopsis pittospori]|uniref:hypothetical protein n=1 Tax=Amycolatopsis pittospori TaxID=2749434 RepID=UPI0015F0EE7A|nr:hypothetical protein [Amycolatopsis pittospori]
MRMYPLQEGEEVLWTGQAQRPRKWFPEYTVVITMIGLAGALIAFGQAFVSLPFYTGMLTVLGILLFPRVSDRRARDRALSYLVTNQRIIFAASWPNGTEFRWVWLRFVQMPPTVKAEKAGVGTITFGGVWSRYQLRENELRGAWAPPFLELRAIADVENVANLIVQAQRRLAESTYTQAP